MAKDITILAKTSEMKGVEGDFASVTANTITELVNKVIKNRLYYLRIEHDDVRLNITVPKYCDKSKSKGAKLNVSKSL